MAEPDSRMRRAGAAMRRVAIDISPLRASRDFRLIWFGQLISLTGRQVTAVALPVQVFLLTRSSLDVGLIGLVQVVPLVVASIARGPLIDRVDRRRVILVTEFGMALTSAMLLVGALHGRPSLWYLYVATGLQAGLSGVNQPARSAVVPTVVDLERLPAAFALTQVMFNATLVIGPAMAGVVIAAGGSHGLALAYGVDVITFAASLFATFMLHPLPPQRVEGEPPPQGWTAIREGFAF